MVERAGVPAGLDAAPDRRDPGSGLPGVDGGPDGKLRQVDAALTSDLDEMQGVGGRAHEHRRAEGFHPGQARR